MGWSIGYDTRWRRDVGYGVPATCDHPGCGKEIDRGLSYICGGDVGGGEHGCGLFFCSDHLHTKVRRFTDGHCQGVQLCIRCGKRSKKGWFEATPDVLEWLEHKATDESWGPWRAEHPDETRVMLERIAQLKAASVGAP